MTQNKAHSFNTHFGIYFSFLVKKGDFLANCFEKCTKLYCYYLSRMVKCNSEMFIFMHF